MARRRIALGTAAGVLLAAVGFLAAGCGGSSAAATQTTTAATTTSSSGGTSTSRSGFAAAFQAYESCLKAHGVTLPNFGRGGFGFRGRPGTGTTTPSTTTAPTTTAPTTTGGTSTNRRPGFFGGGAKLTAKQRQAMAACRSKLPNGGRFRPGTGAGRGGFGFGRGGNGAPSSAAFKKYTQCLAKHGVTLGKGSQNPATFAKAQAACRSLLPTRPTGPPPAATTTTTASSA